MKNIPKLYALLFLLFFAGSLSAQSFFDDFDSYKVGAYLGKSSSTWTTWSNNPGSSEDAQIVDDKSASGNNSIYFYSPKGGGPQDVVLPFGGVHSSGKFEFKAKFFIPNGNSAYFNFQGGSSVGSIWSLEVYLRSYGSFDAGGYLTASYPQDRWFELKVAINFDDNNWEFFIDDTSRGSFSNTNNYVSYLDIYPAEANGIFWVDDVGYCVNYACNPELALDSFNIPSGTLCSNHLTDVELKVKNNGPQVAKQMMLGIDLKGQARTLIPVNLNNLAAGDSVRLTIKDAFKSEVVGTNVQLSAINVQRDVYADNDTSFTKITVNPSPTSRLIMGNPYSGQFKFGKKSDPDIAEASKQIRYEITPPTGMSNSDYGTKWRINGADISYPSGNAAKGFWSFNAPASGKNAYIEITPTKNEVDSMLMLSFSILNQNTKCDTAIGRYIIVAPTPEPNFSFTNPACDGTPIEFTNLAEIHSGTMTYVWRFGDGDTADYKDPVHTYPGAGTYCVQLIATSLPYYTIKDTTICVTVSEMPNVDFKVDNACEGHNIVFTNNTTINTGTINYDWNFGDGSAHSSVKNPVHVYNTAGGYKVTLKATSDKGCVESLQKSANQFASPTANFTFSGSCALSPIHFEDVSTIAGGEYLGRHWDFSGTEIETTPKVDFVFDKAGNMNVTLYSVTRFGCEDTVTKVVKVIPAPMADFTYDIACSATPTQFTNTTGIPGGIKAIYTWNFGDENTSTQESPKHQYAGTGRYKVNLLAHGDNGCSSEKSMEIEVKLQPEVDFEVNDVCEDQLVHFRNNTIVNSSNVEYVWNFGDGDTSHVYAPVKKYDVNETTIFNVSLSATVLDGCSGTKAATVKIGETPNCGFTYKTANTGGLEWNFTADNNTYDQYMWKFGGVGQGSGSSTTFKFPSDGVYRILFIAITSEGCECLDSNQFITIKSSGIADVNSNGIKVLPNPNSGNFSINLPETVNLHNMEIQLVDMLGRTVWLWDGESGITGNTIDVKTTDLPAGNYILKLNGDNLSTTRRIQIH
ncbi:MAG: PKD domain-containing protein [Bacteroidetes bacterium]|nr:PKD domain-containing protein [Bacteroidota bacterium]